MTRQRRQASSLRYRLPCLFPQLGLVDRRDTYWLPARFAFFLQIQINSARKMDTYVLLFSYGRTTSVSLFWDMRRTVQGNNDGTPICAAIGRIFLSSQMAEGTAGRTSGAGCFCAGGNRINRLASACFGTSAGVASTEIWSVPAAVPISDQRKREK